MNVVNSLLFCWMLPVDRAFFAYLCQLMSLTLAPMSEKFNKQKVTTITSAMEDMNVAF